MIPDRPLRETLPRLAACIPLAPRIRLYPSAPQPPVLEEGWLALPQLQPASGSVFGDGSHPTTRLCAAALDVLCRQRRPESVLDVGTGTGVLARIARARGARFVVGTDIDPLAIACAQENAALDAHAVPIHFGPEAPDHWGERFDLVVANILEAPLKELAPALRKALRPGGTLLISGFTRAQMPVLRLAYERERLECMGDACLDEWVLLRFVKP
jgi:ribosomal protein L11 methyltransferase